jgi:hypothetical protein
MYPDRELSRLADHKASLQRDIALRRLQFAEDAARVAHPLEWLDRAAAFWRKFSPLIQISALPLGYLAKRVFFPRFKILSSLAKWGPLAFGAMRGIGSMARSRPGSADDGEG